MPARRCRCTRAAAGSSAGAAPEVSSTRRAPFSGREGRNMEDLELDPVGVVEKNRVVPRRVRVFLRLALEPRAVLAQPCGALVDGGAQVRLDREVVQPDAVAVD